MIKVFIASPYTHGDVKVNLENQRKTAVNLINLGFNPLPISFCYHHLDDPRDYQIWIDLTLAWVEKCDCLLRLPGDSFGADGEVKRANELGIPVFYSIEELIEFFKFSY